MATSKLLALIALLIAAIILVLYLVHFAAWEMALVALVADYVLFRTASVLVS